MERISDVEKLWGTKIGGLVGKSVGVGNTKVEFLGILKDERGDLNAVVRVNEIMVEMLHPSRISVEGSYDSSKV